MKYVPRFFLSDKCFSTTLEEERPFVSSLDLKSYGLFENRNNIYHPRGIQWTLETPAHPQGSLILSENPGDQSLIVWPRLLVQKEKYKDFDSGQILAKCPRHIVLQWGLWLIETSQALIDCNLLLISHSQIRIITEILSEIWSVETKTNKKKVNGI